MHVTRSPKTPWFGEAVDWSELVPGDRVEVHFQDFITDRGTVDCVAEDATVLWVLMERAGQRILLHHLDGVHLPTPEPLLRLVRGERSRSAGDLPATHLSSGPGTARLMRRKDARGPAEIVLGESKRARFC